jgi:MFS family permease
MIVFRVIQGPAAGLMMPTTQNMLVQISGGKNLGQLISYVSIPAALGPILGPVLGGMIVSSLSWRWIFYVNVPVTIIAFLLAWRGLPKDKISDRKVSLDWIGISMLSPAFAILIYGIIQISTHGGLASSAVFVSLIIGVVLMTAFVVYALHRKMLPWWICAFLDQKFFPLPVFCFFLPELS